MLNKQTQSQIRIIAGRWRGRKLIFSATEGLRPTTDRVRETIFNWLQFDIAQSRCLDLFAGSGALGLEAASRGAETVTLVEKNIQAVHYLTDNCRLLAAENCRVVLASAEQFIANNQEQYDIIFLDPPYKANLWTEISEQLMESGLVAPSAYIYLECPAKGDLPTLPNQWQLKKDKKAGVIRYCLFQNTTGDSV
jgi:16S rRNA (guanine966-N2)-methyltransferase